MEIHDPNAVMCGRDSCIHGTMKKCQYLNETSRITALGRLIARQPVKRRAITTMGCLAKERCYLDAITASRCKSFGFDSQRLPACSICGLGCSSCRCPPPCMPHSIPLVCSVEEIMIGHAATIRVASIRWPSRIRIYSVTTGVNPVLHGDRRLFPISTGGKKHDEFERS